MATIYQLKSRFQAMLRPLVRALAFWGVTANQITLLALALSIAAGVAIAVWPDRRWPLMLLPAALLIRMALNAIDGMLAREHGMKSRLGAILNEVGDVLSDAALYLPLAFVPGVAGPLIVAFTVLAIVSEMVGVIAVQIGASRRYDGPLGKSDRAFVFGVVGLLLGCGLSPARGDWTSILLGILIVLEVITIINRAQRALREAPS